MFCSWLFPSSLNYYQIPKPWMVVVRAVLSDVQGEPKRAVSEKLTLDDTLDGTQNEFNEMRTEYTELLLSMNFALELTHVEFNLEEDEMPEH